MACWSRSARPPTRPAPPRRRWRTFCPTRAGEPTGRPWPFVLPNRIRTVVRAGPRLRYPVILLIEDEPSCEKHHEGPSLLPYWEVWEELFHTSTGSRDEPRFPVVLSNICNFIHVDTEAGLRSSDFSQERHNSLPVSQNC